MRCDPVFVSACTGKQRFDTHTQAERSLPKFKRKKADRGRIIMPYRCTHCRGWHVGSGFKVGAGVGK